MENAKKVPGTFFAMGAAFGSLGGTFKRSLWVRLASGTGTHNVGRGFGGPAVEGATQHGARGA